MKKRIAIIGAITGVILLGMMVTGILFAKAPSAPAGSTEEIIILRTFETSGMMPSSMFVINSDGTSEREEIEKINTKNLEANLVKVHAKIRQIIGKGYELSMMSGGNSDGAVCTTYIFKKKGQ
jgi:hypothetical protein